MDDTPLRRRLGLDRPEPSAEAPTQWEHDEADDARPPAASVRGVVRELLETAIFILLVFFIVRGIVQNFKIEGQSMEPNLHGNQYILVNKLVYFHFDVNAPLRLLPGNTNLAARPMYLFSAPHRGDVVVFEYPRDVSKDYIKRVIGLEGDQVQVRDGQVFVNGVALDEAYMHGQPTSCELPNPCANGGVVTVPKGTIFVMGDNRNNSSDSREWGPLPLDRVIGKAAVIYYPLSDWGFIPSATYEAQP